MVGEFARQGLSSQHRTMRWIYALHNRLLLRKNSGICDLNFV